jgi:hypothetical protein
VLAVLNSPRPRFTGVLLAGKQAGALKKPLISKCFANQKTACTYFMETTYYFLFDKVLKSP